jgi:hypothetical protein
MPVKLSTTIKNIELLENTVKSISLAILQLFQSNNTSESYRNQNLKALINFIKFFGPYRDFYQISKKEDILVIKRLVTAVTAIGRTYLMTFFLLRLLWK